MSSQNKERYHLETLSYFPLIMHICVSESGQYLFRKWLVTCRHQAITWTSAGLSSIGLLETNLIWIKIIFIQEKALENVVCHNDGNFVLRELSQLIGPWEILM